MYGYIYKTTNLIDGKIYIGQKKSKKFLCTRYLGSGKYLRNAINKFGKTSFTVELIDTAYTREELDAKEIYWIEKYNSRCLSIGYNITEGGSTGPRYAGKDHWNYGKHHSEDTRRKIKENHKHTKTMLGKHHSEESKRKSSISHKGISPKIKGKIRIHKEGELHDIFIDPSELSSYEKKGYKKGMGKTVRDKLKIKKAKSSLSKTIKCLETGEVFDSLADVARKYKVTVSCISQHVKSEKPVKWINLTFVAMKKDGNIHE